MEQINYFGQTNYRNQMKKFGIKIDDRRRHFYAVGKTGMGKTELLKTMVIQDIKEGNGLGFIDPHGEAAEEILGFIPKERIEDVCYFNPGDLEHPISFNVMERVNVEMRHLVASGLMEVFKKIWPDVWSARMEYILHNTILALLEYPGSTLLSINRMLADEVYRADVISQIKDPVVKAFWTQEFARYTQRYEIEATAAIQNKIGQFISSPLIRNIIGQNESSVNMRQMMDEGKILIFNLSKGRIGEDSSKLLGGLLITKLQLAAMSRVDIEEKKRKDFFLYVDEFQNFATQSFVNVLSEARKYRLNLILTHQYIKQMEEPVMDAVFGNVGTLVCFRVGAEDAEFLEKEFSPEFTAMDLVNLPKRHIYLKLIVDGVAGRPFSAQTLESFKKPLKSYSDQIIQLSREKFSFPRGEVEEKIARWTGNFVLQQQQQPQEHHTTLYDIKCQTCGKWAKVPFKPEPGKPIFCKLCRKKTFNKSYPEENRGEIKTLSLEELLLKPPIAFSRNKKNQVQEPIHMKKEIDRSKLRTLLDKGFPEKSNVLGDSQTARGLGEISEKKMGKIEPGQLVKF